MLKNKPWRTDIRPVDEGVLHAQLSRGWAAFAEVWVEVGAHLDEVHRIYLDKRAINQQRQQEHADATKSSNDN